MERFIIASKLIGILGMVTEDIKNSLAPKPLIDKIVTAAVVAAGTFLIMSYGEFKVNDHRLRSVEKSIITIDDNIKRMMDDFYIPRTGGPHK